MKNLKKISRNGLKSIKGGYTQECVNAWNNMTKCYTSQSQCEMDPSSPTIDLDNPNSPHFCLAVCSRFCY